MFVLVRKLNGRDAFYSFRKGWDDEWSFDHEKAVEMTQEQAKEQADYFWEEIQLICEVRSAN